jgi:hypothetical protein
MYFTLKPPLLHVVLHPQIVSGGLLSLGEVDKSTVGKLAMPAIEPFQQPYVLEVRGDALAQAASGNSGGWFGIGNFFNQHSRHVTIPMVVIISVLGAVLLAAVLVLIVRLARAGKSGRDNLRGTVFDDGVRPVAGGRLSQRQVGGTAGGNRYARVHAPTGGT